MTVLLKSLVREGVAYKGITIECNLLRGFPDTHVLGAGSYFSNQVKHKLKSIFQTNNYKFPKSKKIINISPGIPDDSVTVEIPIVLGLLIASKQIKLPQNILDVSLFIGKLSLSGIAEEVNFSDALIQAAIQNSYKNVFIPKSQLSSYIDVKGVNIIAYSSLKDLISKLTSFDYSKIKNSEHDVQTQQGYLFEDIINNLFAKKALVLGLGGFLNTLLIGEPGVGKTMLLQSLGSIMPPPDRFQIRQIRDGHHQLPSFILDSSLTLRDLVGTSKNPNGLLYKSHFGSLSINEINEVSKPVQHFLKSYLDNKSYSKFGQDVTSVCSFFATMNPCKCGYLGSNTKSCICNDYSKTTYQNKLSYPFLDRFDSLVSFNDLPHAKQLPGQETVQTETAVSQVLKLKSYQSKQKKLIINYSFKDLLKHTNEKSHILFSFINSKLNLSMRRQVKTLRLALLISILKGSEVIHTESLYESIVFQKYLLNYVKA